MRDKFDFLKLGSKTIAKYETLFHALFRYSSDSNATELKKI